MKNIKSLLPLALVVFFSGCAAPAPHYKISDPETTKVFEGEIISVNVQKIKIEDLKKSELKTEDVAKTAIAANNVGNSQVQGALLALDVIDAITTPKHTYHLDIDVKNSENDEVENIDFKYVDYVITKRFSSGDRVRVIYRDEKFVMYNLSRNPKSDEYSR